MADNPAQLKPKIPASSTVATSQKPVLADILNASRTSANNVAYTRLKANSASTTSDDTTDKSTATNVASKASNVPDLDKHVFEFDSWDVYESTHAGLTVNVAVYLDLTQQVDVNMPCPHLVARVSPAQNTRTAAQWDAWENEVGRYFPHMRDAETGDVVLELERHILKTDMYSRFKPASVKASKKHKKRVHALLEAADRKRSTTEDAWAFTWLRHFAEIPLNSLYDQICGELHGAPKYLDTVHQKRVVRIRNELAKLPLHVPGTRAQLYIARTLAELWDQAGIRFDVLTFQTEGCLFGILESKPNALMRHIESANTNIPLRIVMYAYGAFTRRAWPHFVAFKRYLKDVYEDYLTAHIPEKTLAALYTDPTTGTKRNETMITLLDSTVNFSQFEDLYMQGHATAHEYTKDVANRKLFANFPPAKEALHARMVTEAHDQLRATKHLLFRHLSRTFELRFDDTQLVDVGVCPAMEAHRTSVRRGVGPVWTVSTNSREALETMLHQIPNTPQTQVALDTVKSYSSNASATAFNSQMVEALKVLHYARMNINSYSNVAPTSSNAPATVSQKATEVSPPAAFEMTTADAAAMHASINALANHLDKITISANTDKSERANVHTTVHSQATTATDINPLLHASKPDSCSIFEEKEEDSAVNAESNVARLATALDNLATMRGQVSNLPSLQLNTDTMPTLRDASKDVVAVAMERSEHILQLMNDIHSPEVQAYVKSVHTAVDYQEVHEYIIVSMALLSGEYLDNYEVTEQMYLARWREVFAYMRNKVVCVDYRDHRLYKHYWGVLDCHYEQNAELQRYCAQNAYFNTLVPHFADVPLATQPKI